MRAIPKRFKLFENENLIALGNPHDFEVDIYLKDTCNPKVKEMWEKLNQPLKELQNEH